MTHRQHPRLVRWTCHRCGQTVHVHPNAHDLVCTNAGRHRPTPMTPDPDPEDTPE